MRLIALALALLFCRAAGAQIQVSENPAEYKIFTIKYPVPEGHEVRCVWDLPDALDFKPVDSQNLQLHATGPRGSYQAEAMVATWEKGKVDTLNLRQDKVTISISGAGPTPPQPNPPQPNPNPTPNPGPAPPIPPPGGLAALVPDPAHRAMLAEFHADLAAEVRAGAFTSTSHFRAGYRKAIETGKANGTLPQGLSAINKPISDRIVAAITLVDAPLDEAKKTALAVCLESVAAEFKG